MLSRNIRPRSRAGSVSATSTSKCCPLSSTPGPVARAAQADKPAASAAANRRRLRISHGAVGAVKRVDQGSERREVLRIHIVELDADAVFVGADQQRVTLER